MEQIRVVIVRMPRILEDVLYSILSRETDLDLATVPTLSDALSAPEILRVADVVLFSESASTGVDCDSVLHVYPHLRLVAISGDGRRAMLYQLRPNRAQLGLLSSQMLMKAIRTPSASRKVS